MKMQDGSGETSDELCTVIDVLKTTVNTAERAMSPLCASAHAVLILSILKILRKEALPTSPENSQLLVKRLNPTFAGQA